LSDGHPPLDDETRDQIIALLPRLRRFCIAITRSAEAGDDLAQSTVERALSKLDQWQPGSRLDSWMFRIAQNINIDQARSARTRGTQVDVEVLETVMGVDGRDIVEGRDGLARARAAMAKLPEEQRALMALVVIDGQSYKEAASILDIPIGTVMSRIARARAAIAASMHVAGVPFS
jgi:RNA polymerase sigma-70 factor, ECF subfamily